MNTTELKPRATVAAVVEQQGRYLIVEEMIRGQTRLNQPAGHLEHGEDLLQALCRETLEETGYQVEPTGLIGVYQWCAPHNQKHYIRFAFSAKVKDHHPENELDDGIIAAHWLSEQQLVERQPELRSPMVLRIIQDYQKKNQLPLDLIVSMLDS